VAVLDNGVDLRDAASGYCDAGAAVVPDDRIPDVEPCGDGGRGLTVLNSIRSGDVARKR
jgi:hypothetical protein